MLLLDVHGCPRPPQTRHRRKWAQQQEEEACCLAVLAGGLLGEMGYLCLMGLMMLRTFIKVGDDPDILPTFDHSDYL